MPVPSYLEDLTYTDEYKSDQLRVLVYGELGSGKTSFFATFPEVLIVDFDGGTKVASDQHLHMIPFAQQKAAYRKLTALLDDAAQQSGPFSSGEEFANVQTIVIDGITAMSRVFKRQIMSEQGKNPTNVQQKADYDTWGALQAQILGIVEQTKHVPMSIGFTAFPRADQDDLTGEIFKTIQTEGRAREHVGGMVDEVYFFESKINQGTKKIIAYTSDYRGFPAKTRLKLPKPLPYRVENPSYQKLYVEGVTE